MSKHTPGPWKAIPLEKPVSFTEGKGYRSETHWNIHHKSEEADGGFFCEVVPLHSTAEAREIAKANALLIAASPDLLAALKRAVSDELGDNWQVAARAAIAKAEGTACTCQPMAVEGVGVVHHRDCKGA